MILKNITPKNIPKKMRYNNCSWIIVKVKNGIKYYYTTNKKSKNKVYMDLDFSLNSDDACVYTSKKLAEKKIMKIYKDGDDFNLKAIDIKPILYDGGVQILKYYMGSKEFDKSLLISEKLKML